MIRTPAQFIIVIGLFCSNLGCDSAMVDATLKPEVTGQGPREPDAPGKTPGSGKVDLGEVGLGGPLATKAQEDPDGSRKPATSPEGKAR